MKEVKSENVLSNVCVCVLQWKDTCKLLHCGLMLHLFGTKTNSQNSVQNCSFPRHFIACSMKTCRDRITLIVVYK